MVLRTAPRPRVPRTGVPAALGVAPGPGAAGPDFGRSMACSWNRPSRPTTAVTAPAREAGTCGDAVFTIAGAWCGAWTDSSGVPNAADTPAAVPRTGSKMLPGSGVPTVSPSARSAEDTRATSASVGPNAAAYWAGVR